MFLLLENYNIICFGPSDWWGMNPSCTTHIMKRFAEKNRVLYINPVSSDLLGSISRKKRKNIRSRIVRKLKSMSKYIRRPKTNLYVISPLFLPIQGVPLIDWLNNILLRLQLILILRILKMKHPLIWAENIRSVDMIDKIKNRGIVYHVSDMFSKCGYTLNKKALEKRENILTKKADVVICVSKALYKVKKNEHRNVSYLPHGVDFELFRQAVNNHEQLPELKNIEPPIAGYYGTLTNGNDIELLEYCAKNLPEVSFVFVGQVTTGDYSNLFSFSNVHYLGKLPYEKIPALCAAFTVCMLPWRVWDWIKNCNPLKFFEYMSSGRPIVSVEIDEVKSYYSTLTSIAYSSEEFLNAIVWEIENDTFERSQKRVNIAREHSWEKHINIISEIIRNAISNKSVHFDNINS